MAARRAVLVGGHEAGAGGAGGIGASGAGAGPRPPGIVGTGRELHAATGLPGPLAVVPMTFGRDPDLAEHAAQTLRRRALDREPGELLLTRPLGTATHLVGWLRAAAGRAPAGDAVLVAAPVSTPEQDAELFRVARLVRQYGSRRWVEVALIGGDPDVAEAVDRCRRLGAPGVTVLPASLVPVAPDAPDAQGQEIRVRYGGPLLAPAALRRLVDERVAVAERRWELYRDDGIGAPEAGHHHDHDHDHHHDHDHVH